MTTPDLDIDLAVFIAKILVISKIIDNPLNKNKIISRDQQQEPPLHNNMADNTRPTKAEYRMQITKNCAN